MPQNQQIFRNTFPSRKWSSRRQMAYVYKEFGIKARTQTIQMVKLALGRQKILPPHYFTYSLYRPNLSKEKRSQYIGYKASHKINAKLSPKKMLASSGLLNDKIGYSLLLEGCGFEVTQTQAFFHPIRQIQNIHSIKNATGICDFLKNTVTFPIFGKPQNGSRAIGTASVMSISADGTTLTLGNGTEVSTAQYASEIVDFFPRGYLFQTYVQQHKDIITLCPNAVGTVRMITILQEAGPELLYAIWKVPCDTAMADNGAGSDATSVLIDAKSGKALSAFSEDESGLTKIDLAPSLKGKQLPNWPKMLEIVKNGHLVTPDYGVIGWDIAMGKNGPVIIEANPAPIHTQYQTTTGEPFLNPKFAKKLGAAVAFANKRLKDLEALEIVEVKRNTTERISKALNR